jgi:rare lipoprotein A (peptidoglycan hydrolase)
MNQETDDPLIRISVNWRKIRRGLIFLISLARTLGEFVLKSILKLLTLIVKGFYDTYTGIKRFAKSRQRGVWIILLVLLLAIIVSILTWKQFRIFGLEASQTSIENEAQRQVKEKEQEIEKLKQEIEQKDEKIQELSYIQSQRRVSVSSMSIEGSTLFGEGKLEGRISHYSREGCLGCDPERIMANGEPLDDNRLTIAVPPNTIPMNTQVLVTNQDNGKSVVALVTDTGGFTKYNRVADLTLAVGRALETKTDVSSVKIEILD